MARENRSGSRDRMGLCIGEDCNMAKEKEIQHIRPGKDFVCEECNRELREYRIPKSWWDKHSIKILIPAAILVLGVGIYFIIPQKKVAETEILTAATVETRIDTTVQKSIKVTEELEETQLKEESLSQETSKKTSEATSKQSQTTIAEENGSGRLHLSYGTYSGDIVNGYPSGMGRLTYSTSWLINKHDSKKRMAEKGDYVIGEFVRGFLVQGKWYNTAGELKESLMIGVPPTKGYNSK